MSVTSAGTPPLAEDSDGLLTWYALSLLERALSQLRYTLVIRTATVLYMLSSVITVTLNALLAVTIVRSRALRRKVVCLYVLSLCLANLLYGVKTFVYHVITSASAARSSGEESRHVYDVIHDANNYLVILCFLATMYTMLALCTHQYWSIVHVYRRQAGRTLTTTIIAAVWLCSAAVSAGIFTARRRLTEDHWHIKESAQDVCLAVGLIIVAVTFLIPVTAFTALSTITICQLRKTNEMELLHPEDAMPLKRRALRMLLATFALFAATWSAFWLLQLYHSLVRVVPAHRYVYIYSAGGSLVISYSWVNVALYLYFFNDLRHAFYITCTCGAAKTSQRQCQSVSLQQAGALLRR